MNDEDFKTKVLESLIRLEPVCKNVESLMKWRDGNGIPGARFQLGVLWAVFIALLVKVWGKV
jgi:hypothetical protein